MTIYKINTPSGVLNIKGDSHPSMDKIKQAESEANKNPELFLKTPEKQKEGFKLQTPVGIIATEGLKALDKNFFNTGSSETQAHLDIEEDKNRPSILKQFGMAADSAEKSLGSLLLAGEKFAKNPIQSSKAIGKAAIGMSHLDLAKGIVDIAEGIGKTVAGFDIDRPGVGLEKFDRDVRIKRLTEKPVQALGDFLIFNQGIKAANTALKAGTASEKIVMHKALKRSGKDIEKVSNEFNEAFNKKTTASNQSDIITRGQEVASRGETIGGMNMAQLNSAEFPIMKSRELTNSLLEVGKIEAKDMNKALDKAATKEVSTVGILSNTRKQLVDEGFATDVDEALEIGVQGAAKSTDGVNIITPLTKGKLNKLIEVMDEGGSMSVKELKNVLDTLDDVINYKTSRTSDKGLKILRGEVRSALGNAVKPYDKIATRISDRLFKIGVPEAKLRSGAKDPFANLDRNKIGLEIAKDPDKSQAFIDAMITIGKTKKKVSKHAGEAVSSYKEIDAWNVWNELYETNNKFAVAGDASGKAAGVFLMKGQQRLRKTFPNTDIPTKIRSGSRAVGRGIKSGAKLGGRVSIASTLAEDIPTLNRR